MKIDIDDEAAIEAVAKALANAEKKRQLEAVAAIAFDCSVFEKAGTMLSDAGRRDSVIIGWALISFCLDCAVRQHLSHGSKKDLEELLDGLGPLSSDAAKLKLAKALGWLAPEIFDAVNMVRKLRNVVAHQIVRNEDVAGYAGLPDTFRDQIDDVLEAVRLHAEAKTGLKFRTLPIDDGVRMKCALVMLASHVLGSIVFGPARLRLGLTGGSVFFESGESPQWWIDATRATARASVVIIRAGVADSGDKA